MDIGTEVITALTGGGAAVARMEIARLANSAVARLSRRGRVAQELARVADAAVRSDSDLAEAMDRLTSDERSAAATQLNDALSYEGNDLEEKAATQSLATQAGEVRQLLMNYGLITGTNAGVSVNTNTGQIISQTGSGTVHAPFRVRGDYHAGRDES